MNYVKEIIRDIKFIVNGIWSCIWLYVLLTLSGRYYKRAERNLEKMSKIFEKEKA